MDSPNIQGNVYFLKCMYLKQSTVHFEAYYSCIAGKGLLSTSAK